MSIVTKPQRSYDNMDPDVFNMSRWGLYFQDNTYPWAIGDTSALGYIEFFETLERDAGLAGPEPSPTFWAVWHDWALAATVELTDNEAVAGAYAQLRLDAEPLNRPRYEPLADWERELLGWNEHIGWQTLKQGNYTYNSEIWNILAGD